MTAKKGIDSARRRDPFAMLDALAHNLWWSWNADAMRLFEYIDPAGLAAAGNNPIVMLSQLSVADRRRLGGDEGFLQEVSRVHERFKRYMKDAGWFGRTYDRQYCGKVAYFCMEYGLHESLPLYAGGLGILAGDHLKSCSDLGIPFVAVGVYWQKGYTRQRIDAKGCQQDVFPVLPSKATPMTEVCGRGGRPLRFTIPLRENKVAVRAWRLDVGRVPLYLLDTNLPENARRHRQLVDVLYSGDRDMRIRQEILLGIGGWRLLKALRIPVMACHLNEGHAAFLSLERMAEYIRQEGATCKQAHRYVFNTNVFTTHTPVPAGNEAFDPALVDRYLAGYVKALRLTPEAFHDLARVVPGNAKEPFGMTPLALHTSKHCNGVAALHGEVARRMWQKVYPGRKLKGVPIGHVTNGIHLRTWLHPEMGHLLDAVLGEDWHEAQDRASLWRRVQRIADESLWHLHQHFKLELIEMCRTRTQDFLSRHKVRGLKPADADNILDPEALTIGFARRFAPYKRATLVFTDAARFARILGHRKRPVQIIFAGKAHPADEPGKAIIQQLVKYAWSPRFRGRVVFIEDYDMAIARRMVAGVDVWLNNPMRPQEASGTSGMKPTLHGGLNLSILDGWWPEGYNRRNGWAIGTGKDHDGTKSADLRDARDLYRALEREVVPLFYKRDRSGLPRQWIARMKASLASIPVFFNSHRQVKEYLKKYYLPAMRKA